MAFVFTNNVTPTNGSDLMYRLKTLLLSANWILKGNGDATNVSDVADNTATAAGTDYITSAGAMAATNAWWRVRMAGTSPQMEFVFQRGTTNLVWRDQVLSDRFRGWHGDRDEGCRLRPTKLFFAAGALMRPRRSPRSLRRMVVTVCTSLQTTRRPTGGST
jgi:hypothetical protein